MTPPVRLRSSLHPVRLSFDILAANWVNYLNCVRQRPWPFGRKRLSMAKCRAPTCETSCVERMLFASESRWRARPAGVYGSKVSRARVQPPPPWCGAEPAKDCWSCSSPQAISQRGGIGFPTPRMKAKAAGSEWKLPGRPRIRGPRSTPFGGVKNWEAPAPINNAGEYTSTVAEA